MPNWCSNTLNITGDKADRDAFVQKVQSTEGEYAILASIVPMPKELEGSVSPMPDSPEPHPNWANLLANGEITQEWHDELVASNRHRYEEGIRLRELTGYTDWYNWEVANWGVKWGDSSTILCEHSEAETIFRFETPWGPPDTGMAAVSAAFPSLRFVLGYIGEGCEFVGAALFVKGQVAEEVDASVETISGYYELADEEKWDELDFLVMKKCDSLMDLLA